MYIGRYHGCLNFSSCASREGGWYTWCWGVISSWWSSNLTSLGVCLFLFSHIPIHITIQPLWYKMPVLVVATCLTRSICALCLYPLRHNCQRWPCSHIPCTSTSQTDTSLCLYVAGMAVVSLSIWSSHAYIVHQSPIKDNHIYSVTLLLFLTPSCRRHEEKPLHSIYWICCQQEKCT